MKACHLDDISHLMCAQHHSLMDTTKACAGTRRTESRKSTRTKVPPAQSNSATFDLPPLPGLCLMIVL